jgi:AcrR family transcriptional regulator
VADRDGASSSGPGRSRGRPVVVDGDETRERILREARACFALNGYAATTTRMIAERAGLATAAIYHHFGRKRELMLAVHQATQVVNLTRMRAAIDAAETFVAKVNALLDMTHQALREDPEQAIFMSVARDEARRHPELREIAVDRTFPDLFEELIDYGIRTGAIAKKDAIAAQGAVAAVALGVAMLSTDMSLETHGVITEGCKRLVDATLIHDHQDAVPAIRRTKPKRRHGDDTIAAWR